MRATAPKFMPVGGERGHGPLLTARLVHCVRGVRALMGVCV